MNTDSVSLIEVLAAARRQHASLVVESSGYLLLAISRGMGGLAVDVDPAAMMLRTDGALTLTGPRARCAAEDAAHTLRQLAQRLLDVSIGKSTGLRAAIRPPEDGRNPLNGLITGVTKALIPLNRSAAKRALARLARETIRAKKRGQLRAEDIQREAEEIAAACARGPAVQTSAPAAARQESVYSSTPIPYSLPATSAHPAPSGLSQLDVDIEIELVTPTPPPADAAALELRTVTPPPVLAQPFSASVPLATTGLANTPTGSASSASCSDVHDRVTATEPDDFAARAARADGIADDDPDAAEAVRHSADTVALAAAVVDAAPAAAVAAFDAVDKEPDVLEEFRIEDDEDDMDADLKSDVSELVQCALSQVDDVDIAGADFSPLNDDVRYTPSPAAGEPADDASVEAMLAGFGGEGADEAVNRAADCLNEMMRLDVPARGREISAAERRVIASLNAHPSDAHAAPSSSAAAQPLEANTPSPEEPSPEVVVEFEEDEISLPPELPSPVVAGERAADHDMKHGAAESCGEDAAAVPSWGHIDADSWPGEDLDGAAEGDSIPPMLVVERPRVRRVPMLLSAMLLLTGVGAVGVLWKKPEFYRHLKTVGSEVMAATPGEGVCYAPLAMRDLPAQHEVLLHLGVVGDEPLATPLPTGVRLELVVTSAHHQARRLVVAANDAWSATEAGPMRHLTAKLAAGVTSQWPAGAGLEVGGVGPAGHVTVASEVAGAEVWLVVNAGGGDRAEIAVPCERAARLMVVDTGGALRQRQLHLQAELLRAAARSGGAELSGKL